MNNHTTSVNDLHKRGRKELALILLHGDLDDVIPRLATEVGIQEAANRLSTPQVRINHVWVARWLKNNGYRRVARWENAS
jgi:alpha-beta hydrolase superfamily lysophospholipase